MSSRVAQPEESLRAEPVLWPALPSVAGPPPADEQELRESKAALSSTIEELELTRARVAELEQALIETGEGAYRKGHAEGTHTACELAEKERALLLERITHAIADLAMLRGRIRHEAEADLVKLSLAIARRITHREMSVDPGALLGVVRSALAKVPASELTKVRLHPSMVKTVRFQLEGLKVPASVEIEADPALEPGDLVMETAGGLLDASIDTQLREIERGFCDRLQA